MNDGGFYQVDNAFIKERGKALGFRAIAVLNVLLSHADTRRQCYPSHEAIGEMIGMSRPTVIKALNVLREHNIITWDARNEKGKHAHRYTISEAVFPAKTDVKDFYNDPHTDVKEADNDPPSDVKNVDIDPFENGQSDVKNDADRCKDFLHEEYKTKNIPQLQPQVRTHPQLGTGEMRGARALSPASRDGPDPLCLAVMSICKIGPVAAEDEGIQRELGKAVPLLRRMGATPDLMPWFLVYFRESWRDRIEPPLIKHIPTRFEAFLEWYEEKQKKKQTEPPHVRIKKERQEANQAAREILRRNGVILGGEK